VVALRIIYDIGRIIDAWEPPDRPHCSNCLNCRVYGTSANPLVYCKAGYDEGKRVELGRVARSHRPHGFKAASKCPSFDSMDDQ